MSRDERGSALALVPAVAVIALGLGSLAIDGSHRLLATRRLAAACDDAANDAVTVAIDPRRLHDGQGVHLDPGRARHAMDAAMRSAGITGVQLAVAVGTTSDGRPTVEVQVHQPVRRLGLVALFGVTTEDATVSTICVATADTTRR